MEDYYDDVISFESLRKALTKCCRNVRWKDSVVGYEGNALKNTYNLRQSLIDGSYKIDKYKRFTIYEPKKREIVATKIKDRQFQMSLCENGLYDDITEHFIKDNPACQKNKGTDYVLNRMTAHLRKYNLKYGNEGWVLKCDIHHFFPETDHEVLKQEVKRYIGDERAYQKVCEIIDSFDGDKGVGLGSQVSQLVELALLNRLDHYIKEKLKIKHYIRYMDDFILIHPDKEYLKQCLVEIKSILADIKLTLNDKTTLYPLRQGVKFLKWNFRIMESGKILQTMSGEKLGKERRRLRKLLANEHNGLLPEGSARISLESWLANAERGDTYWQRQRMIQFFEEEERRYKNVENPQKERTVTGTDRGEQNAPVTGQG